MPDRSPPQRVGWKKGWQACNLCGRCTWRLEARWRNPLSPIDRIRNYVRCLKCGLIYYIGSDDEPSYDASYYVFQTHDSESWAKAFEQYERLSSVPAFSRRAGKLLEIGCGQGRLLKILQESGWSCKGLDVSGQAVEQARIFLGLDVVCGTVEELADGAERFAIIVACDVVEHVKNPRSFFKACATLLEPGGVLFIETPNAGSLYRLIGGDQWIGYNEFHNFVFSKNTLAGYGVISGLEVEEMWTFNHNLLKGLWTCSGFKRKIGLLLRRMGLLRHKRSCNSGSAVIPSVPVDAIRAIVAEHGAKISETVCANLPKKTLWGDNIVAVFRKPS